jgi:hypothetical protein
LTKKGYEFLSYNKLKDAQEEFMKALNVDQYGKSANIGLTKTLLEQCEQNQTFCEDAEKYSKLISDMKYVNDENFKFYFPSD